MKIRRRRSRPVLRAVPAAPPNTHDAGEPFLPKVDAGWSTPAGPSQFRRRSRMLSRRRARSSRPRRGSAQNRIRTDPYFGFAVGSMPGVDRPCSSRAVLERQRAFADTARAGRDVQKNFVSSSSTSTRYQGGRSDVADRLGIASAVPHSRGFHQSAMQSHHRRGGSARGRFARLRFAGHEVLVARHTGDRQCSLAQQRGHPRAVLSADYAFAALRAGRRISTILREPGGRTAGGKLMRRTSTANSRRSSVTSRSCSRRTKAD